MSSKFKIGGLVLMAAIAMSAVMATAAQAGEFTAEEYPVTVTGTQTAKHEFKFQTGTVACAKATFDGTLEEASETLTVSADYKECKTPNGGVSVKMNSCDFLLHAGETLENDRVDGSLDVQCDVEGDEIEFHEPANGCTIKIPAQEGLGTIVYTNKKMAKDFEMDINLTEMTYTQNEKCNMQGTFEDGQYLGKSTMLGDEEIGVQVS